MKDYYSILGIPRYASEQTIKEAYRRLAKRWHPDANQGNEDAQRFMQDLNRAKEILFEKETRDDYRRLLEMQDALSAENIERLRRKWSERRFQQTPGMPAPKTFARGRFILLMSLISIAVGVAIVRLSEVSSSKQASGDPIDNIIRRNSTTDLFPNPESDTITVPNVAPDRLLQMATVLAMMNEYKSASKYWEKYLESDPHNVEVTTSIMLAQLRLNRVAKAMQIIRDHITEDTSLIVIYSELGDYFRAEHQPFDADNAYEKVVQLGTKVHDPSDRIRSYLQQAQKRIDNR
ncbi:MAG: DnaJ domain-containing protein [Bacteroidota bacterium]|nr:DnaJ domain-containing protein [Bacteroidota bacterium]MDP4230781.1 DnaJ domain-containing protein [Bacteroidota bacterium]MDP4236174.1 DnaJ domain-containing protein [Bacteroidota bacterium]